MCDLYRKSVGYATRKANREGNLTASQIRSRNMAKRQAEIDYYKGFKESCNLLDRIIQKHLPTLIALNEELDSND